MTITVHPCHERNLLCLIANQMASCSCLCCSSWCAIIGSPNGKGLYCITVIRHLCHTTVMSTLKANVPFMNNSCLTLVMLCVFAVPEEVKRSCVRLDKLIRTPILQLMEQCGGRYSNQLKDYKHCISSTWNKYIFKTNTRPNLKPKSIAVQPGLQHINLKTPWPSCGCACFHPSW